MILYCAADNDYVAMSNGYGIEFGEVLKSFSEMPFIGRVQYWDERNDLREKVVGKVLFFNNGRKARDRTFAPV